MINQRKRVAKRLASGLMAGAVAIGGLAISGAWSPAGAVPVELINAQRLSGSDRFETSASVAEELDDLNAGVSNVIVANGDNFPDALAAASLAGDDTPILLVKSNSIPTVVSNRMARLANDAAGVIVIGGTSAVSADVFAQVESIFDDSVVTRISGADRYATAREIADEVGLDDGTVIIASGTGYADAVSVGGYAAANGTPILLAGQSGLDADTLSWISDAVGDGDLDRVLIIGGPAAVNSSVETQLIEVGVEIEGISRIAGPDRYITNLLWNLEEFGSPLAKHLDSDESRSLAGISAILVSGANFPDALAAAPLSAALGAHIVLTDGSASGGFAWNTLAGASKTALTLDTAVVSGVTSALTDNAIQLGDTHIFQDLWVVGGTTVIPQSTIDAGATAADDTVTCTVDVVGANDLNGDGPIEFAVTFSKNFVRGAAGLAVLAGAGVPDLEAVGGAFDLVYGEDDYIADNFATLFDVDRTDVAGVSFDDSDLDGFLDTVYVETVDPLEEGARVSFRGWDADAEDYGTVITDRVAPLPDTVNAVGLRNFAECEGAVTRDRVGPTAAITAAGWDASTHTIYIEFSESLQGTEAAIVADLVDDISTTAAMDADCDMNSGKTRAICELSGATWDVDSVIELDGGTYQDDAGNDLVRVSGSTSADPLSSPVYEAFAAPTISATSSCVKMGSGGFKDDVWQAYWGADANAGDESGEITITLSEGDLVLSGQSGLTGLDANGYSFTFVQSRGLLAPTLAVNGKSVTITIDRFVHTGSDIARLINSSSIGRGGLSPLWSAEGDDDGLVSVADIGASFTTENSGVEATQTCLVTVSTSSAMNVPLSYVTSKPANSGEVRVSIGGTVQSDLVDHSLNYRSPGDAGEVGGNRFYYVVNNTNDGGAVRVEAYTEDISGSFEAYRSVTVS